MCVCVCVCGGEGGGLGGGGYVGIHLLVILMIQPTDVSYALARPECSERKPYTSLAPAKHSVLGSANNGLSGTRK